MEFTFSKHAKDQFGIRGISLEVVHGIINNPEQIIKDGPCKIIYQRAMTENNKKYLYRIFVNICKTPAIVITGYKTSKIEKYEN